ncbi:hypothetical protein V1525DRAFT_346031 [Lipomyces kononenkoae]|uniref:Uncharacterized protein n=1 Tax=Lipomyces kononenkoae TaxID=34357 RepID=A0ACC3SZ94_LIPKO
MWQFPVNFKLKKIVIPRTKVFGLLALFFSLFFTASILRTKPNAQLPPSDGRWPAIPNIVHYVHLMSDPEGKIPFELKHFISVYSASLYFNPDCIYIHTDATDYEIQRANSSDEASDKWSRLIFNLPKVVINKEVAPDYAQNGQKILNLENKSDFVRAKVVYDFGGVYLDWDVHALRDFKPLREAGFANVVGLQVDDQVQTGCFLAIKESEMMRIWLKYEHIVYDGGWITHAVILLTHLSRKLVMIPHEVLILDRYAFGPSSWLQDDAQVLFGSHSEAPAPHLKAADPHRPALTTADAEELWEEERASSREAWEKDYSNSYAIHAFKSHDLENFDKISLQYVLSRRSNFARAVYPVVQHAIEAGVIPLDG